MKEQNTSPANSNPKILYIKNMKNRKIVRWYLMTYPQSSKGLTEGLNREIQRREKNGETAIEYFAPTFVETVEHNGKLDVSEKLLLFNYFFVKASEEQIYRMKQFEPQYNFFRKRYNEDGVGIFPFVSEEVIRTLRYIAAAYCGKLPIYNNQNAWLIKGDKVKIIRGQFKGLEATLFANQHSGEKEIMVSLDNISWVPFINLKSGDYQLLELYNKNTSACELLNDKQLRDLHEALLRYYHHHCERSDKKSGNNKAVIANDSVIANEAKQSQCREDGITSVVSLPRNDSIVIANAVEQSQYNIDRELVINIVSQYENISPSSDVKRSKMFSALLLAYKILEEEDKLNGLVNEIKQMLPAIKAEHPKALLLLSLYATTANEVYRNQFLEHTTSWTNVKGLKKNKQILLEKYEEIVAVVK